MTNDVDAVSGAMQQALIGIVNAFLGIVMAVSMMFLHQYLHGIGFIDHDPSLLIDFSHDRQKSQRLQGMQNALGDLNGYKKT